MSRVLSIRTLICLAVAGLPVVGAEDSTVAHARELATARPAGAVSGVVTDASGQPMQGVRVRLIGQHGLDVHLSGPVDRLGRYALSDLPQGRFAVHVIWIESGDVYPRLPSIDVWAGDATRLDIQLRFSFPEPYPGPAAWARWKRSKSDAHLLTDEARGDRDEGAELTVDK